MGEWVSERKNTEIKEGWIIEWINEWKDGFMNEWQYCAKEGWIIEWINEWKYGFMNEWQNCAKVLLLVYKGFTVCCNASNPCTWDFNEGKKKHRKPKIHYAYSS